MKRRVELLAPGGDLDSIKAAVKAGADAIYCGLDRFNARQRAANITLDDLGGVLAFAHRHDCRVYLTLNIMMVDSDIHAVVGILNKLVNTSLDGVIVQDLGVLHLLKTHFEGLKVHASTQLTTHNEGQLEFLSKLAATRVNLSRELSLDEIQLLAQTGHEQGLSIEAFVHGSLCISFSGICYMSSVHRGHSGNRGRCSQPCRDRYITTPAGKDFPFNLKDNSAYFDLERMADAGVDAVKIEGRMKTFHYVYTVTNTYRKRLDSLYHRDKPVDDSSDLYRVFNRDYSNGFLVGDIGRQMFSDHPRNRQITHLRRGGRNSEDQAYEAIAEFKAEVAEKIAHVPIGRAPLTLRVSGKSGTPLEVAVHTPNTSFVVASDSCLALQRSDSTVPPLDAEMLQKRLKAVNQTEYYIDELDLEGLQTGLFVPLKELRFIKKSILFHLNASTEPIDPIAVPVFAEPSKATVEPTLSVLIAATRDVYLCEETGADIHFQLPNGMKDRRAALVDLFADNDRLIPWFPAVLIGEDYASAVRFLRQVRPRRIVTNNSGIAYEAHKEDVPWIAGPYLNVANSLSLVSLKENFACSGAFVSNELSQSQIRRLCPPEDLELHYSIYHPIVLLTSRQCLFHQVTGCEKDTVDDACLGQCEKSSTATHMKLGSLLVKKTKGSYSSIYHRAHFLNTKIVSDIPFLFSSFLVDLRDIETETRVALDKPGLVQLFDDLLRGHPDASRKLERKILPTTSNQYEKGI